MMIRCSVLKIYFLLLVTILLQSCSGGSNSEGKEDAEEASKPPILVLDYQEEVVVGFVESVSGSRSYSQNNEELDFSWELINKPEASQLDISTISHQKRWDFIPDDTGDFTFKLMISGRKSNLSTTETFTISVTNNAPTLELEQSVQELEVNEVTNIELSSNDADGHQVSYLWRFTQYPDTYSGPLAGAVEESGLSYSFDQEGEYSIEIQASDGFDESPVEILSFHVHPRLYSLYPLSFTPSQSLFLESKNSLLLIDEDSPFLFVFNVTNSQFTKVELPLKPLKIAISPDQSTVAVSTKSSVLLLDFETKEIISETKTEVYGGYPVFYNGNNKDVMVFAGRRLFNAYRYPLRYVKDGALLPKLLTQYSNGEWGLEFKELVTGGSIAKINPKTNDIYYSTPSIFSGRPFTRLRISNDEVVSSYDPTIHQNSVGTNFWIDTNGNILTSGGILLKNFEGETISDSNDEDPFLRRIPSDGYQDTYIAGASPSPARNELLITPAESWGRQGKDMSRVYLYNYQTFEFIKSFRLPQVNDIDGNRYELRPLDVYHSNYGLSHVVLSSYKNSSQDAKEQYFISIYGGGTHVDKSFTKHEVIINPDSTPIVGESVDIQFDLLSFYGDPNAGIDLNIVNFPEGALFEVNKQSSQHFIFKTDKPGVYTYSYSSTVEGSTHAFGQFLVSSRYDHQVKFLGQSIVDVADQIDNGYIYAIDSTGVVYKVDRTTLAVESIDLFDKGYKVQLSPSGDILVASTGFGLYVLSASSLEVLKSLTTIYGAKDITFRNNIEFFLSPDYEDPTGVPDALLRFNLDLDLVDSDPLVGIRNNCLYLSPSDDLFCKEMRIDIEESQLGNYYLTHYRENSSSNFWLSHDDNLMIKSIGAVQKFLEQPTFLGLDNKELIDDMVYQTLVGAKGERIAYWAWGVNDSVGYRIKGGYWQEYNSLESSKIDVIDNEYFNVVDSINFETVVFMDGDELMYAKFVMPSNQTKLVNSIVCSETTENCYFIRSNLIE